MRVGPAIFVLIALTVIPARRGECVEETTASQVDREVARLSSERWRDRRDAVDKLIQIGPPAELRLRRLVGQSPSPEVRLRAQAALRHIAGVRRTQATILTLSLTDASAKDAFDQVAELEGAELLTNPPDLLGGVSAHVSARFERRTYWQVILDLCRRLNLRARFEGDGVKLAKAGQEPQESVGSSGAFLFRGRLVSWSRDPGELGRSLRLDVCGEPRAEVLRVDWKVDLSEVTDSDGRSLLPLVESGINLGAADSHGNGGSWTIPLRAVQKPDTFLKLVKGKVKLVLAEGEQTLELPGASGDRSLAGLGPVAISTGGMTASILRVLQTDKDYEMDVQIAVDPNQVDFDALLSSIQGRFRTFDADGKELALKNVWRDGGGPMNNIRCRWGSKEGQATVGAPFKLLWRVPTKTLAITVPFELKDVRMN